MWEYILWEGGNKCIYSKDFTLYYLILEDSGWTKEKKIDFKGFKSSGLFGTNISKEGDILFYNSLDRELPGNETNLLCPIWYSSLEDIENVTSEFSGFGGMHPSVAGSGDIYFTYTTEYGNDCIARRRKTGDSYGEIEIIQQPVYSSNYNDRHPFIDPNATFLIFDSEDRPKINNCKLFVVFRISPDKWSEPINMGKYITQNNASMARISTDGKYLFFNDKDAQCWWISSEIIDDLKHEVYERQQK